MQMFLVATAEAAIMMPSGIGVGLILDGSKNQTESQDLNETAILVAVALFVCAIICRFVADFQRTESCIKK